MELAFLTDLELSTLFSKPIRPELNYRFWPTLYADFWGDYWRYWRESLGHDALPTSPATISGLVFALWIALPVSGLMLAGLLTGGRRLKSPMNTDVRTHLHTFVRIVTLVSLGGFLVFAARYAEPGKGDTVKSVYIVYLVPFLAWLGSAALHALIQAFPKRLWPWYTLLAALVIFVIPNCLYQPVPRMFGRTWAEPQVQHADDVTFAGAYTLVGYDLAFDADAEQLHVTLAWRADDYTGAGYKVFVHLIGADGQPIAQSDAIPSAWQRPTQSWMLGEFVSDPHTLGVSRDALSAGGQLFVGLYSEVDGQRLLTSTGGDHISLALHNVWE
jgi:hypothetical protein